MYFSNEQTSQKASVVRNRQFELKHKTTLPIAEFIASLCQL